MSFGKSFKSELGKNAGKWVSNVVFGDGHSTPYRRVGPNTYRESKPTRAELKYQLQLEQLEAHETLLHNEKLNRLDSVINKNVDIIVKIRIPSDKEELLHLLSELSVKVLSNQWEEETTVEAKIKNRYANALMEKYKQCVLRLAAIAPSSPELAYFENIIIKDRRKKFLKKGVYFVVPLIFFIYAILSGESPWVTIGIVGIILVSLTFIICFPRKLSSGIKQFASGQEEQRKIIQDLGVEDSFERNDNSLYVDRNVNIFIEDRLSEIWDRHFKSLPEFINERGFCYSINNEQKDVLITGINPSFRKNIDSNESFGFDIQMEFQKTEYDTYWSTIKKMIHDDEADIDLRMVTAYLDIFYFREKEQNVLRKEIIPSKNGIQFIVDQLNLTQHIIEDLIKPKLIIVKNKESAVYWGKFADKGKIWMGYDFEFIENYSSGELFRIKGLIDSQQRIAREIKSTNLENTLVLFTDHITQFTKIEKRPTARLIREILDKHVL